MKFGNLRRCIIKPIIDYSAFWDKSTQTETLVISTHGLIKKTAKTPLSDLEKAERLRQKYFDFKSKKK